MMTTETFYAPSPATPVVSDSYNRILSTDLINIIKGTLSNGEYGNFWQAATVGTTRDSIVSELPKIITSFITNKYYHIHDNQKVEFLEGFAYFMQQQGRFYKHDLIKFMGGMENRFFEDAVRLLSKEYFPIFAWLRNDTSLGTYQISHEAVVRTKNTELLEELYSCCTNIAHNHSHILYDYLNHDFMDYNFTKSAIEKYDLDINAVGNRHGTSIAFTHLFFKLKISSREYLQNFIKDFGKQMNLEQAGYGKYNVFQILKKHTNKPLDEVMDCYDGILNHCYLTEKHIADIAQYLLSPHIVAEFYDHAAYTSLFKHHAFNTPRFDRSAILNTILTADSTSLLENIRQKYSNTVNPTTVLLDKFYGMSEPITQKGQHPFLYWANLQGYNFSRDTLYYLVKHYKVDIEGMNYKDIPSVLKRELKGLGFYNIPEVGLWQKWFGKKNQQSEPVKVELPKAVSEKESFNTIFISQIKDTEIHKYIEAILLNAEQYTMMFSDNSYSDDSHYIATLLPKFLNKAMNSYLHFSTIEPEEAKEHILVQLKLLNKKTFEILNSGLQSEKENAIRQERIQNRIIKQYDN